MLSHARAAFDLNDTVVPQMIFPEFVEFLGRHARAVCGSSVTLADSICIIIRDDVLPKLKKCKMMST